MKTNNMNTTSILKPNVPQVMRWSEYLESVTILIPQSWYTAAKPLGIATSTFWIDLNHELLERTYRLQREPDGLYPRINIESTASIWKPQLGKCTFRKDGIPELDEDDEPVQDGAGILASEEVKHSIRCIARDYFLSGLEDFFRHWMAKMEAIRQEGEIYDYA
jgi:hypothetical protein